MLACKPCRTPIEVKVTNVKNNVVSVEIGKNVKSQGKYRAMNSVTCEVMWALKILSELDVNVSLLVTIDCDNSSGIQIAANPVLQDVETKGFAPGLA
ncbi:hypothetical protein Tco_1088635 [Tanacetum coccineum]